jgi:hypothetical protein
MAVLDSTVWDIDLYIGNSAINFGNSSSNSGNPDNVEKFEWASYLNSGYTIRATVLSPNWQTFATLMDDFYKSVRQTESPVVVRFRIGWRSSGSDFDLKHTPWRTAILTDINSYGSAHYGAPFEFVAIDPISYFINRGMKDAGKVYRGKIGGDDGVIRKVLDEYIPSHLNIVTDESVKRSDIANGRSIQINKTVGDTNDPPSVYGMMHQNAKSFIMSLLEWSASFTPNQTSWIVSCGEDNDGLNISITESYTPVDKLLRRKSGPNIKPSVPIFQFGGAVNKTASNVRKWKFEGNAMTATLYTVLTTSGISSVSGQYYDDDTLSVRNYNPQTGEEFYSGDVIVNDRMTPNKINPSTDIKRAFDRPLYEDYGWTHIPSLVEPSAGDLGPYKNYISGKARQIYFNMLRFISRMDIQAQGEPTLYDSYDLGRMFITLQFPADQPASDWRSPFDGNWILDGWHHRLGPHGWTTDVSMYRIDWNAFAYPGYDGYGNITRQLELM